MRSRAVSRLASPSPSQDPKGFFWLIMALFITMLTIGMAALLFGCGHADKPAQSRPTTVPRDTVRERLQTEHTANLDTVTARKTTSSSTQKPYENAVIDFDSVRKLLPR